jgi:hypothetical protein
MRPIAAQRRRIGKCNFVNGSSV